MTGETLIFALLGLPLLASALTLLLRHQPDLRDGQAVLIGLVTAACAIALYGRPDGDHVTILTLAAGLDISFTTEPLGKLFALVAGVLWPLATLYTIGYMRGAGEANHTRFMFFYAIAIHAAMAIALSGNLLTLFVFYEILTFSTYPLVTHKGTPEAMRAGRVYLGILVASSVILLLFGVIGVWVIADTLTFTTGGVLAGKIDPFYVPFLLALRSYVTGVGSGRRSGPCSVAVGCSMHDLPFSVECVCAAAYRTYGTGSWSLAAMALAHVASDAASSLPKVTTACRRTLGAGSSSLGTMAAA